MTQQIGLTLIILLSHFWLINVKIRITKLLITKRKQRKMKMALERFYN